MISKGVPESYADYMMGHLPDKYGYNDVESLGVEKLRNIYATANLRIREAHKAGDNELLIKTLKTLVKESGLDPDKVIMWEALNETQPFAEPHRSIVSPKDFEDGQIRALSSALRESIKQEIMSGGYYGPANFCPEGVGPRGVNASRQNPQDPPHTHGVRENKPSRRKKAGRSA